MWNYSNVSDFSRLLFLDNVLLIMPTLTRWHSGAQKLASANLFFFHVSVVHSKVHFSFLSFFYLTKHKYLCCVWTGWSRKRSQSSSLCNLVAGFSLSSTPVITKGTEKTRQTFFGDGSVDGGRMRFSFLFFFFVLTNKSTPIFAVMLGSLTRRCCSFVGIVGWGGGGVRTVVALALWRVRWKRKTWL